LTYLKEGEERARLTFVLLQSGVIACHSILWNSRKKSRMKMGWMKLIKA